MSFGDRPVGSCLSFTQKNTVALLDGLKLNPLMWNRKTNYIQIRKSRDIICVTEIKDWPDFFKVHEVEKMHQAGVQKI